MNKRVMVWVLLLQILAPLAMAECARESPPLIPDGATVSENELKTAQGSIKSYMASTNAFLACLDAEGAAAAQPEPDADKIARTEKYNAAVDEMSDIASKFNAAVKAFKATQK